MGEYGMKGKIPVLGLASMGNEGVMLPQMGDHAEGLWSVFTYSAFVGTPQNKAFVQKFIKKAGMWPNGYSLLGLFSAQFVWEALNKIDGQAEDAHRFIKALESTKITGPQGQVLQFHKNHSLPLNLYILEARKDKGEIHNFHIDIIERVEDPVERFPK